MQRTMALRAKGDEVIRCVGPTMGAEDLVVAHEDCFERHSSDSASRRARGPRDISVDSLLYPACVESRHSILGRELEVSKFC